MARAVPIDGGGLGTGRYARLHVLLEKTILNVDVLNLDVHVDQATADKIEGIVKGHDRTPERERAVVSAVLGASAAYAELKFLRGFGREDFVKGSLGDLGKAYQAKLIDRSEYDRVNRDFAGWFAFLGDRGVEKGDLLKNRGGASGLRSVFVDNGGKQRMDITTPGRPPMRTLLATYLAPGGELRDPLVGSLFTRDAQA
ncbi:MAG: hypothetical protein HOV80_15130 [Polyangiaceae bacterium]|nr:hypothetical protein [Polyangiaceae bacterium]